MIIKEVLFTGLYLLSDIVWISTMSHLFYKPRIEKIQKQELTFRKIPAIIAYIVLVLTMFFICKPMSLYYQSVFKPRTIISKCLVYALSFSLVGFSIYSIFNLTNYAIFTNYDLLMLCVDTLWGTLSFALFGILSKMLNL